MSKVQIYVSNLPANTSSDRLKAAFAKYGPIADNFVPQRKRFGFVTFEKEADQQKALAMHEQHLDQEAAAAGAEPLSVTIARVKGEDKQPKKAAPAKKAPKKAAAPKKAPAPAKGEGGKEKKDAPKKRAKKVATEPRVKQSNGVNVQARKDNYASEMAAKCLLLGYANQQVASETANYEQNRAKPGFPGLEWLQRVLQPGGWQKSLFYKNHTVVYAAQDDGSWTVTVNGSDVEPFSWKGTDPCPEQSDTLKALCRDLLNEAKFSMSLDDEEIAMNRAKIYLVNKLQRLGAAAKSEKEPPKKPPAAKKLIPQKPDKELSLDEQRAQARANAAQFAANLTPEEAAIYGAKVQVAASGVRPDSDEEDDGGADFAVGGDDDGVLLGDY